MSEKKKTEFIDGGWRQVEETKSTESSRVIDAHYQMFSRFGHSRGCIALETVQYHVPDFNEFWCKSNGKRVRQ